MRYTRKTTTKIYGLSHKTVLIIASIGIVSFSLFSVNQGLWAETATTTSGGGNSSTSSIDISASSAPLPPSSFSATPSQNCEIGAIYLSWSASLQATGYRIYRDNSVLIYDGPNLAFADTGLAFGSNHTYILKAYNSYGFSGPVTAGSNASTECSVSSSGGSGTSSTASSIAVLPRPSTFYASLGSCGTGSIYLFWSSVPDASAYRIYRDNSILIYDGPNLTFVDTGLSAGSSHNYTAKAYNSYSISDGISTSAYAPSFCLSNTTDTSSSSTTSSSSSSGTTSTQTEAISGELPQKIYLTAGIGTCDSETINLYWPTSYLATGYRLYRGDTLIFYGQSNHFIDTRLPPSTSFNYSIQPYNNYGIGEKTSVSVKSPPVCPSTTTTTTSTTPTTSTSSTSPTPTYLQTTETATTSGSNALGGTSTTSSGTSFETITETAVYVRPNSISIFTGEKVSFSALVNGVVSNNILWSLSEGAKAGFISDGGAYLAPNWPGVFHIVAHPVNGGKNGYATVTVQSRPLVENEEMPKPAEDPTQQIEAIVTQKTSTSLAVPEDLRDVGEIIESQRVLIMDVKTKLVEIISQSVNQTIQSVDPDKLQVIEPELQKLKTSLTSEIEEELAKLSTISESEINKLSGKITDRLKQIDVILSTVTQQKTNTPSTFGAIDQVLNDFHEESVVFSDELKREGGDLLFKDTNKDGISDFESKKIYGLDPEKPSPQSSYEGKSITASEKIILGFDPSLKELVKIKYEEPANSPAPVLENYKLSEVKLSEEKKVVLSGQFLPNSFVTLYIYSTPIVVTVKANAKGEWQYVLDKELNDGEHVVYSATVNNSGKILARSQGFIFAKTAEAATLGSLPLSEKVINTKKPGLFEDEYFIPMLVIVFLACLSTLITIGLRSKKINQP